MTIHENVSETGEDHSVFLERLHSQISNANSSLQSSGIKGRFELEPIGFERQTLWFASPSTEKFPLAEDGSLKFLRRSCAVIFCEAGEQPGFREHQNVERGTEQEVSQLVAGWIVQAPGFNL